MAGSLRRLNAAVTCKLKDHDGGHLPAAGRPAHTCSTTQA